MDVTSELGIPEGWKVTKMGAKYAITCPNIDDFDGGLDDLAEYLGIKICYNGRWNYGKGKYRVKKKDSLDITSELRLPVGWKVTKTGSSHYIITRPNGSRFDGGLGTLAENLGIEICYNGHMYHGKKKKR